MGLLRSFKCHRLMKLLVFPMLLYPLKVRKCLSRPISNLWRIRHRRIRLNWGQLDLKILNRVLYHCHLFISGHGIKTFPKRFHLSWRSKNFVLETHIKLIPGVRSELFSFDPSFPAFVIHFVFDK